MRTTMALGAALSSVVLALVWRGSADPAPTIHVAVLRDRSGSNGVGCDATVGLLAQGLNRLGQSKRSSMTLLVTGDAASADEPVDVPLPVPPRPSRKSIESPSAVGRQQSEYLREALSRCEQRGTSSHSPIYQAIARMIEHLRRAGDDRSRRIALIQSDLEELSNAVIRDALRAPATPARLTRLPALDNTGIEVAVCGLAETRGTAQAADGPVVRFTRPRQQDGGARQRAVWAAIFTDADRVAFAPFCPRWRNEIAERSSVAVSGAVTQPLSAHE